MTLLKIVKRSISSVNVAVDYNPSVFRYFLEGQEVKLDIVKNLLKPAFLGMLDTFFLPNSSDFEELSNWTFSDPVLSSGTAGGQGTTINTYNGIKYVYRPEVSTQLTAVIPAQLNGFTGRTFSGQQHPMTGQWIYTETSDLNEITYAEFLNPGDPPEIVDIEVVGGTPRIPATFSVTPQGYYPVQGLETGTHGKDDTVFRPLSFWDEYVPPEDTGAEYTGILREEKSGFMLDISKISLTLTEQGEALGRYNPIDLITFTELIKLQYEYRQAKTMEKVI